MIIPHWLLAWGLGPGFDCKGSKFPPFSPRESALCQTELGVMLVSSRQH